MDKIPSISGLNDIAVYIPLYNSADWCKGFMPLPGINYYASDNASTDGSGDILAKKGVTVIRHQQSVGRVGNWEFCINHFIGTGYSWFKWLFAGDELFEGWEIAVLEAANDYPEAKLIIAEFDIDINGTNFNWEMFDKTQVVQPADAMKKASYINWFGSPISTIIHRDALLKHNRFSDLDWAADMVFCVNIASSFPTLYLKKKIGAFHSKYRNYYTAHVSSPFSFMEEAITYNKALKLYGQLTKDNEFCDKRRLEISNELLYRMNPVPHVAIKESFLKKIFKKL
ncbi:hypothetical protein [Parasediminibacterium sp. JCM 36343]|uniref:hypothetical protein n=1 Tax=Parasediminibacterium sp. JCM 36343 TaxID=3374279 RepID=UPI00397D25FC